MADFNMTGQPEDDRYDPDSDYVTQSGANRLTKMTNLAGALVSLALIAGIGVWGYKLLMRDVSGIPVVRAAQGDMRIRPENPGGRQAQHQGLAVNRVAAENAPEKPADRLVLAPRPMDLSDEDQPVGTQAVAAAQQSPLADAAATADAKTEDDVMDNLVSVMANGSVEDIVAELTAGAEAVFETATKRAPADADTAGAADLGDAASALPQDLAVAAAIAVAMEASGPISVARPRLRPKDGPAAVVPASLPDASAVQEIDPASISAGTRLVQLGAYESEAVAKSEWDKLFGRFGAYLDGKDRVIQRANSGGRVFFRLRAMGFEDLSAARRFCSVLVAEKADCIPVVTR